MSLVPDPLPPSFPRPYQENDAALGFQRWKERLATLEEGPLVGYLEEITAAEGPRCLLSVIFSHSPFLTDCVLKEPETLAKLLQKGPDSAMKGVLALLQEPPDGADKAMMMRRIRQIRRKAALIIALADLTDAWSLEQVTGSLTDLAIGLMELALAHILLACASRGQVTLANPDQPLKDCGYVALGMGKLGARELNFSSDIDLIVIFDPEKLGNESRYGPMELAQRMTRDFVALLSERTADGYAFRVDLRLRPDPAATPLAVSLHAALGYYESMGQNWERAAMIKARPVVGDLAMGRDFLKEIRPFMWRRSLDFQAIQDIHAIKGQIHATKGGSQVAIEGHNVKLGRGGIREIEFYAQTQQLIWGGRAPALRSNRTKEALMALAAEGLVKRATAGELCDSYDYLRRVEHRLQMVADQQTHSLPGDATGIERLAAFLGLKDGSALREELLLNLHRVEDHYAELFEDAPAPSDPGSLVFTGMSAEPDTIATLTKLGFEDPERVFDLVSSWHHGRYRATRSRTAREALTLLMPNLLKAFGRSADPDAALSAFHKFLAGLPTGVQLFTMLQANPQLLDLLASVMGSAPALAQHLARRPALIDSMLSPDFFEPMPKREELRAEMEDQLASARAYEEELDILRRVVHDRRFQAGVQLLRGLAGEATVARRLSDIADAALGCLVDRVMTEFARRHGRIEGAKFAIIELGKLGSREMTATSDLDLVFVYELPEGTIGSDGAKALDPVTYFTRFAQRLINGITAPTAEGTLYSIDMRLRPAGDAGPVVTTLAGFERYHRKEAWTWEHMALTRARVLSNHEAFRQHVADHLRSILLSEHEPRKLLVDILEMRERLTRDKPPTGPWDIKMRKGGLIDCEFLAQYWQLAHAHTHPEILEGDTELVFAAVVQAGLIGEDEIEELTGALRFLRRLQGYLRLTLGEAASDADMAGAPPAIREGLTRTCGALDFAWLQDTLEVVADRVSESFDQHIAGPAREIIAEQESIEETQG